MIDMKRYHLFWEATAVRLIHPTQFLVVEALLRIERPLSPTLLNDVYDEGYVGLWDYHCKRLTALGLLELAMRVQVRGTAENYYWLRTGDS